MVLLNDAFEAETGKSIIHVLEKDSGGHFLYALRGLALGPLGFDVWLVHHACHGMGQHGMGHHEDILTEVLAGRPNAEIQALKAAYHKVFHVDLAHVVKKELTHHTERMFTMILAVSPFLSVNILTCQGHRPPENYHEDPRHLASDVQTLFDAAQGRVGTDDIEFCGVILNRSDEEIRQISHEYKQRHHHTLLSIIEREFSGHVRRCLLYVVEGALNRVERDAQQINAALTGDGAKEERLAYRLIRVHWMGQPYMQSVKQAFSETFNHSLHAKVQAHVFGELEKLLLALVEGR